MYQISFEERTHNDNSPKPLIMHTQIQVDIFKFPLFWYG